LQDKCAKLLTRKKSAYAEYRVTRDEMKELLIHKNNKDHILSTDERKAEIEKGHDRQLTVLPNKRSLNAQPQK